MLWAAELDASRGELARAVRIAGAAEMAHKRVKIRIPPRDGSRQEGMLARARMELGEESFKRSWEEGRAMDLERAIEFCVSDS